VLVFLHVLIIFIKGLFFQILKNKKKSKLYLSTHQILNKFSYRITNNSHYDKLIFLREYKYILSSLFKRKESFFCYDIEGDAIILEGGNSFIEKEKAYVNYHHKDVVLHSYLSKDNIISLNFSNMFDKIIILFLLNIFSLPIFLITLFSVKRANISLAVRELIEIILLIKYLLKNKINLIYDFIPYEKDSNFLSYCLGSFSVEILKIPSLGPLNTHNHFIIADKLITSSAYHKEEVFLLKDNFFVSSYEKWLPEHALDYLEIYPIKENIQIQSSIGFYSHACWLRQEDGNLKSPLFSYNDEIELLNILAQYSLKIREKIIVFPHPKELLKANKKKAKKFYRDIFSDNFEFFESGKTAMNFHKIDIAVSTYSTVLFERLLMGYKSIFYTKSINFPIDGSALKNICFNNKEDLINRIELFSNYSNKIFFEINSLENYVFNKEFIK